MKLPILFIVCTFCCLAVFADDPAESKPAEQVHEPNSESTKDSAQCKCNAEGPDATCDHHGGKHEGHEGHEGHKAPETASEQSDNTCTPGEMFKNDCNDCKCPDSGHKAEAACTIMACP